MEKRDSLEYYFANTGFYDFLPMALDLISTMGFNREEAIMAVCKVFDKARVYPPIKNRAAWFSIVFKEKLLSHGLKFLLLEKPRVKSIICRVVDSPLPGSFLFIEN